MPIIVFEWPYFALFLLFFFLYKKIKSDNNLIPILRMPNTKNYSNISQKNFKQKPPWLILFLYFLMILALMRPIFQEKPLPIEKKGRNLMLALDISESMKTPDMIVNNENQDRLTAAKYIVADFIDKRLNDRIGLVVFGSEAFLHAPLTFDHKTLKQFLFEAQIGFAGGKTAIGDAVLVAIKKLREQKNGDKILILLTDGQNNSGSTEPLDAAKLAKEQGIKIYTIGIGSDELKINTFFGPANINPSQDLEEGEETLKEMASITNGRYFRGKNLSSLKEIYQELDKLLPVPDEDVSIIPKKELFIWPLGLMAVLLVLAFFYNIFFKRNNT